jgi:hypothetical protein
MPDIGKLIPKLPAFAFNYWDGFLGICFVLVALFQGVTPGNYSLLLSGFGLLGFSMARRCWHYIGSVRIGEYSPQFKRTLVYPKFLASLFWLAVAAICFRYAAITFPDFAKISIANAQVHRVSVSYPSHWEPGEFRNCRLGHPHYAGDPWPEFDCDGSGSHGEATPGTHAFVMDVRFMGEYKVPTNTDSRYWTWTCQSSIAGTGELTCKGWQ